MKKSKKIKKTKNPLKIYPKKKKLKNFILMINSFLSSLYKKNLKKNTKKNKKKEK